MHTIIPKEHRVIVEFDKKKPWQVISTFYWRPVHDEIGFETLDEAVEMAAVREGRRRSDSRATKRQAILQNCLTNEHQPRTRYQIRHEGTIMTHAALLRLRDLFTNSRGKLIDSQAFLENTTGTDFVLCGLTEEDLKTEVQKKYERAQAKRKLREEYLENGHNQRRDVAKIMKQAVLQYLAESVKAGLRDDGIDSGDEICVSFAPFFGPMRAPTRRPPFKMSQLLDAAKFTEERFVVLPFEEYSELVDKVVEAELDKAGSGQSRETDEA